MEILAICDGCHMNSLENYFKENSDKEKIEPPWFILNLLYTELSIKP